MERSSSMRPITKRYNRWLLRLTLDLGSDGETCRRRQSQEHWRIQLLQSRTTRSHQICQDQTRGASNRNTSIPSTTILCGLAQGGGNPCHRPLLGNHNEIYDAGSKVQSTPSSRK